MSSANANAATRVDAPSGGDLDGHRVRDRLHLRVNGVRESRSSTLSLRRRNSGGSKEAGTSARDYWDFDEDLSDIDRPLPGSVERLFS